MVFQKKGEKVASNAHQSFNQSSNNMEERIVWCKKGCHSLVQKGGAYSLVQKGGAYSLDPSLVPPIACIVLYVFFRRIWAHETDICNTDRGRRKFKNNLCSGVQLLGKSF